MNEQAEIKDTALQTVDDVKVERLLTGVTTSYKEIRSLQKELSILKELLSDALSSQEERIALRKLELENEQIIRKIEYDKIREQESHQWERSLPIASEKIGEIVKSLSAVKEIDIELVKTGRNGRNGKIDGDGSISLEDLLNAYEEPLGKVGIIIDHSIIPGFDIKNGDILKTALIHESGEWLASYSRLNLDHVPSCTCLAQQKSSALKYAKRHNLQCLLGQ